MSLEEEIAQAIRSHKRWKVALIAAVESGAVNAYVGDVGSDNICPLVGG